MSSVSLEENLSVFEISKRFQIGISYSLELRGEAKNIV